MLVNVLILLLVQDQKKVMNSTREVLESNEFKKRLHERLSICLLSQNLTAYLTGLPSRIMELIRKDPDGFGLTREMLNVSGMFPTIQSLVCEELTAIRASMKYKIRISMGGKDSTKPKQDIRTLVKALAPPGMDIKTTHWSRIAFLRCCYVDFRKKLATPPGAPRQDDTSTNAGNTNASSVGDEPDATTSDDSGQAKYISVSERVYTPTGYWKYVDDVLQEARMTVCEDKLSPADELKHWTSFFTSAHQRDLVAFPIQEEVNTAGLTTIAGTSTSNMSAMTNVSWQEQVDTALNW
ncbi:hypothetical protein BD779DRAFT_1677071 [Infundibulicybe gibba]|nr:hypothetical protein BD779DRAFT_1677071 [Infundibulicybe gibba]